MMASETMVIANKSPSGLMLGRGSNMFQTPINSERHMRLNPSVRKNQTRCLSHVLKVHPGFSSTHSTKETAISVLTTVIPSMLALPPSLSWLTSACCGIYAPIYALVFTIYSLFIAVNGRLLIGGGEGGKAL